jgi:hypothetical protein
MYCILSFVKHVNVKFLHAFLLMCMHSKLHWCYTLKFMISGGVGRAAVSDPLGELGGGGGLAVRLDPLVQVSRRI